jgi:hypothetical protein
MKNSEFHDYNTRSREALKVPRDRIKLTQENIDYYVPKSASIHETLYICRRYICILFITIYLVTILDTSCNNFLMVNTSKLLLL